MSDAEIITRRDLPHWYMPGAAHFVTYRLYGSLPKQALQEIRERKEILLNRKPQSGFTVRQYREKVHKQLFATYDKWLDQDRQSHLADPRVAATVRSNLYHHHGSKYNLLAYCIMPNHVHVLFQPIDVVTDDSLVETKGLTGEPPVATIPVGEQPDRLSPLSKIMHSLKSYTAHKINRILGRSGVFWQSESYDHWVRDDDELERIVHYIRANPMRAGLTKRPEDWYFSSCHDRFLSDGDTSDWLLWDRSAGGSPAGAL